MDFFVECCEARKNDILIERVSRTDKEFHFQNWIEDRLTDAGILYDPPGRNSYPDFTVVNHAEGYEAKGLAFPGRWTTYDSNSRVPTGFHNGRTIYYVFGRYPKDASEVRYPVVDLVVCHGDFLNIDRTYVHKNESVRSFGSYGDISIRDRKMYVAPTPYALVEGTIGQATLIAPAGEIVDSRLEEVGELLRVEARDLVVGYHFDLQSNLLTQEFAPNPSAGEKHVFTAYRMKGQGSGSVFMKRREQTWAEPQLRIEDADEAF